MSSRRLHWVLGLLLVAGAAGLALHGQPSVDDRVEHMRDTLDTELAQDAVVIDPGELLALMHDDRMRLRVVDLREEARFNLFHLLDSQRVEPDALALDWGEELHPETVIVLVDEEPAPAEEAFRRLRARGFANVYLLGGGVRAWVDAWDQCLDDGHLQPIRPASYSGDSGGRQRRLFPAALGERHPLARPPKDALKHRSYEAKVKVSRPAATLSGGCG